MLNREQIEGILPHRGDALFISRCESPDQNNMTITAKFTIPDNAPFLDGHFPGNPIVPAFIIIEALAQLGGIIVMSRDGYQGKTAVLGGIEKARFRRPLRPGDVAEFFVQVDRLRRMAGQGHGYVKVGDELCCEAQLTFFIG